MILDELGNLSSSMAIEDSEETVSVPDIQFGDVSVLHVASPPLHLRAAKTYSGVLSFVVLFFLIWSITEPS